MTAPAFWERYPAMLHRVIDGDTFELVVDLGFGTYQKIVVRLEGIDTPEMPTAAGVQASTFTLRWFADRADHSGRIMILPKKNSQDDYVRTFVRYVATVTDMSGTFDLAEDLRSAGHEKTPAAKDK